MLLIVKYKDNAVYQNLDGTFQAVTKVFSYRLKTLKEALRYAGFTSKGEPLRYKEQPAFVPIHTPDEEEL